MNSTSFVPYFDNPTLFTSQGVPENLKTKPKKMSKGRKLQGGGSSDTLRTNIEKDNLQLRLETEQITNYNPYVRFLLRVTIQSKYHALGI